ncbi:MAG: hypothetical protein R3F59_20080 [Myxococcota bacterium]
MRALSIGLLTGLAALAGCSAGKGPVTTTEPTVATLPDGLHGDPASDNLALPTFDEVVSRDGSPASNADFLGRPTVLWFYPAAMTGG